MLKKIILGILLVTVLGAGGAALAYNTNQEEYGTLSSTPEPLASALGDSRGQNGVQAAQVQTADGQVLAVQSESGQPLWSSGSINSQGQNGGQANSDHVPEPQAGADDWVTLEGTLLSFQGGSMTMSTSDGEIVAFQTGQPRFFAEQKVTFQVGNEIFVLGFYEDGQFKAGEITQVSTGLRVMLRDPNGRPLWAGPGNGGSGENNRGGGSKGSNGSGGQGNS